MKYPIGENIPNWVFSSVSLLVRLTWRLSLAKPLKLTMNCAQCTVGKVYSLQYTVCTVYSVNSVQCTACTVYSVQCTVYSVYSVQYTLFSFPSRVSPPPQWPVQDSISHQKTPGLG